MRKITFLITLLWGLISYSQNQNCEQIFSEEGFDSASTTLTVTSTDLTCAAGTINSITITDALLIDSESYWYGEDASCDEWYEFILNIDGVTSTVCAEDLIGMDITNFQTLTITAVDTDDYDDLMYLDLEITVNFVLENVPACSTVTGPTTLTEAALNGLLTWTSSNAIDGYTINVGTTSGGTDIVSGHIVQNVLNYNIPGTLEANQEYFVNITPFNAIGDAEGCIEYTFTTPTILPGNLCDDAITINNLPYSVTSNTDINFDTIYEGTPGAAQNCGTISPYLNGNDVIYSYTAGLTGSINFTLNPTANYAGMFIYNSCENIGVACQAGAINGSSTNPITIMDFDVTEGETYYILISTYASPQSTGYSLNIVENTCTNPTATYSVVSACTNGESQFMVNVNVTNLGTASSLTISDNLGSIAQVVDNTGIVTFGPYTNNNPVTIRVNNTDDANCFIISTPQNQTACPPSNDNCTEAIELIPATTFALSAIVATNELATRNVSDHDVTSVTSTCDTANFNTSGKDVWFTTVVPDSGTITIETGSNSGSTMTDSGLYVYSGDCDNQTYLKCNSDIGGGNNFSRVSLVDRTPGETLYIRVFGYNGTQGTFKVGAYDASLSTPQFENGKLSIYPNPVKDVLNISHSKNIDSVEIFNILGQKVLAKSINNTQDVVSMQELTSGTYLVKVTSENEVKTIKVIKN